MQKNQTFSCLFRHYAKYNGLREDDLVFEFTDELQSEQSPESVHLMPLDEIWVYHKKQDNKGVSKSDLLPNECFIFSHSLIHLTLTLLLIAHVTLLNLTHTYLTHLTCLQ
jgi:hypothetical protein